MRKSFPRGPYKMLVSDEQRFWPKVYKTPNCWLWIASRKGGKNKDYGAFHTGGRLKRKAWYAHRYSYFLHHGFVPDDLCIIHICDNSLCVNPEHLKAATHDENMDDAYSKNKLKPFGKNQAMDYMTRQKVREMKKKGLSVPQIARNMKLNRQAVRRV